MRKFINKITITLFVLALFVFGWFWTEGYGTFTNNWYGKTIEDAVKYGYNIRGRITGMGGITGKYNKIIYTVDIEKKKKLVFYESENELLYKDKKLLSVALVKKKWNNKWIIVRQAGTLPFERPEEYDEAVGWFYLDMVYFNLYVGINYDENIDRVTVSGEDSVFYYYEDANKNIWYHITEDSLFLPDTTDSSYDIKGYDKSGEILYECKTKDR